MQAFLFMYFIAYIAFVSFFWTMQTFESGKEKKINPHRLKSYVYV